MVEHLKIFLDKLDHLNKILASIAYKGLFYCLDPHAKSAILVGKDAARITRHFSHGSNSKIKVDGYVKLRDKNARRTKTGYVIKIDE